MFSVVLSCQLEPTNQPTNSHRQQPGSRNPSNYWEPILFVIESPTLHPDRPLPLPPTPLPLLLSNAPTGARSRRRRGPRGGVCDRLGPRHPDRSLPSAQGNPPPLGSPRVGVQHFFKPLRPPRPANSFSLSGQCRGSSASPAQTPVCFLVDGGDTPPNEKSQQRPPSRSRPRAPRASPPSPSPSRPLALPPSSWSQSAAVLPTKQQCHGSERFVVPPSQKRPPRIQSPIHIIHIIIKFIFFIVGCFCVTVGMIQISDEI